MNKVQRQSVLGFLQDGFKTDLQDDGLHSTFGFFMNGVTEAILFGLSDHSENLIQLCQDCRDEDKFRILVENLTLSDSGVNPSRLNENEWIKAYVTIEPYSDSWRATFLYNGVPSGSQAVGILQFNNLVKAEGQIACRK